MTQNIEGISHVDADELQQWLNDPERDNVYIIDVREPEEYTSGHIPGIPLLSMGEFPELIDQFDKDAEYVFVCRSGRRSLEVAKFFKNEGIENVHNYEGGMLAWDNDVVLGEEHIVNDFTDMNQLERKRQR